LLRFAERVPLVDSPAGQGAGQVGDRRADPLRKPFVTTTLPSSEEVRGARS
jgi:hypothetical protein